MIKQSGTIPLEHRFVQCSCSESQLTSREHLSALTRAQIRMLTSAGVPPDANSRVQKPALSVICIDNACIASQAVDLRSICVAHRIPAVSTTCNVINEQRAPAQ